MPGRLLSQFIIEKKEEQRKKIELIDYGTAEKEQILRKICNTPIASLMLKS